MIIRIVGMSLILALLAAAQCWAVSDADLERIFAGAERVDLRISRAPAVVKLREVVKLPPPEDVVLVKSFDRESVPSEIAHTFADRESGESVSGVTINGRFIGIIRSEFDKQYQDVLNHELVHAYISLAGPGPLPYWFQEASAIHFSTDAERRVYGKPSEKVRGATEIVVHDLPADYKQKLHNFHFLIERVGSEEFYAWYREAVKSGIVDVRPLFGLPTEPSSVAEGDTGSRHIVLGVIGIAVIIGVFVGGFVVARRQGDFGG